MAAPATGAGAAGALRVTVLSPEQTIYQGAADQVVAPAWNGQLGILRGHAPLMALLGEGELRVTLAGKETVYHVAGGFLQVLDDEVTVLSERASAA
jgi:F-type H+-transporting ATPase subunit epsilon